MGDAVLSNITSPCPGMFSSDICLLLKTVVLMFQEGDLYTKQLLYTGLGLNLIIFYDKDRRCVPRCLTIDSYRYR